MILGINVDENFVYVSIDGKNQIDVYPFSIGRDISMKTWFIGENANNENVNNGEVIIDKLYYLMENNGVARIDENEYNSMELIKIFFSNLLSKYVPIDYVVVVVRECKIGILEKINNAISFILHDTQKCKVTSYSEAFAANIRAKSNNNYDKIIALFNFTEKALTYYELIKYTVGDGTEYWQVNENNYLSLPLDLLSGDQGKLLCDNLLTQFSYNCMKDKEYSNIILTGVGFSEQANYRDFMTYVCRLSNVETDIDYIAEGAKNFAKECVNNNTKSNISLFTDARTTAYIKLKARVNMKMEDIVLVEPGIEWFYIGENVFNIILDGSTDRDINFEIVKVIEETIINKTIHLPDNIVLRDGKTNCFEISLKYIEQNLLEICITDKGFGEFFEPQNESINLPVNIE